MTTTSEIELPYNWVPRDYQVPLWQYMAKPHAPRDDGSIPGKRAVCLWHRRAGKDLCGINIVQTEAYKRVGLYWHLLPTYQQGRKIVWNGFTRDGRKFLDHFHPDLVESTHNTEMRVNFKNGSIYQVVGTDDVDKLVGTNPIGCIFSEYSLQDPRAWDYIRPILAENGGFAIFIYTPRGRNHGYDLYTMAAGNPDWFCQSLDIFTTGAVHPSVLDEERAAGMPEPLIKQEYLCSFDAALVGSYFGDLLETAQNEQRIGAFPYDPKLPVITAWDLGMHDSMSIWFAQRHYGEVRLIDYYENHGQGFEHYAKVLKDRGYVYDYHIAPWDIEVRELGTGKSRIEVARNFGINFRANRRVTQTQEKINAARQMLNRCYFNQPRMLSDGNGINGLECLKQFRKEFDTKKKIYKDRPEHDWTSHGASAFMELAWGIKEPVDSSKLQHNAVMERDFDDFDPFDNVIEARF